MFFLCTPFSLHLLIVFTNIIHRPTTDSPDKPKIDKILGYAYEREWQEQLKEWQGKQDVGRNRHRHMTNAASNAEEQNFQTEYNTSFGKRSTVVHSHLDR